MKQHPCIGCGACCAHFRVQFYWREANQGEQPEQRISVPMEMTEELDSRFRCMKGTNDKHHPKCVALNGKIGKDASCTIYSARPTPCRDFKASFEDGHRYQRCDDARMFHGLKPLQPSDW